MNSTRVILVVIIAVILSPYLGTSLLKYLNLRGLPLRLLSLSGIVLGEWCRRAPCRDISILGRSICSVCRGYHRRSIGQQSIIYHYQWIGQKSVYQHRGLRNRSQKGRWYSYVYRNGIYLRYNWNGEFKNVAILLATAVNEDRYCEVLGVLNIWKQIRVVRHIQYDLEE